MELEAEYLVQHRRLHKEPSSPEQQSRQQLFQPQQKQLHVHKELEPNQRRQHEVQQRLMQLQLMQQRQLQQKQQQPLLQQQQQLHQQQEQQKQKQQPPPQQQQRRQQQQQRRQQSQPRPQASPAPTPQGNLTLSVSAGARKEDEAQRLAREQRSTLDRSRREIVAKLTRQLQVCLARVQKGDLDDRAKEKYQDMIAALRAQMDKVSGVS